MHGSNAPGESAGEGTEHSIGPGISLLDHRRTGDTRTALYLHGLGSSQDGEKAEFFRRSFVGRGLSFCSIDFRGHGRSQGSNLELSLTRHLEDVRIARRHLTEQGVEQIDLIGSSLGALAALWSARLEPAGIRRVGVIAPALGIRQKIRSLLDDSLMQRWRDDGNLPYVNELGTTVIGYGFYEDLDDYPDEKLADGYRTPTLVLQGELDETVDPALVHRFAERVECVELESWPHGDHRLTEELPEVFRALDAFLSAPASS